MCNLKKQCRGISSTLHLVRSNRMDYNAHVGDVYQPEGLIESKTSENVSWSIATKCSIPDATKRNVEDSCKSDTTHCCFLHCFLLRWRRLQRTLRFEQTSNMCCNDIPPLTWITWTIKRKCKQKQCSPRRAAHSSLCPSPTILQ